MLQVKYLDSVMIVSVDHKALLDSLHVIAEQIKVENRFVRSICLFGSFHKGNYTPESDIDILILLKENDEPFLMRSDQFSPFFVNIPFDVNILVYTVMELHHMREKGSHFIEEILSESRDLLTQQTQV